jgi:hypothetical protein
LTKAEIIDRTLAAFGLDDENRQFALDELQKRLPDVDIKTCEDFKHLNVECCEDCHHVYPHYDMSVIDLPDGGKAWVCDTVKWAIYPEKYQELQEWWKNSPAGKLLNEIFGEFDK